MKLHSFDKIILKLRSETIIRVATNQNREGIVRAKKITERHPEYT